jgi:hypothetical protein
MPAMPRHAIPGSDRPATSCRQVDVLIDTHFFAIIPLEDTSTYELGQFFASMCISLELRHSKLVHRPLPTAHYL